MCTIPNITDAEWEILKIIWANSEISSSNIIKELKDTSKWKPATIKTLINRLLNKNAIGFNKIGYEYIYFPLVSKNDCINLESYSFVNKVFNGSIKSMLMAFVCSGLISESDINKLKCTAPTDYRKSE